MLPDLMNSVHAIIHPDQAQKPKSLMERVLEGLQMGQPEIEKYNKFKRFRLWALFLPIIMWMSQGTKNISAIFCEVEGAQGALGFSRSSLYDKLASPLIEWCGLAHAIMMSVAKLLLKLHPGDEGFLVLDDSNIERDRAKKCELGSNKLFDHNTRRWHRGFCLIQIGVAISNLFVPVAFKLYGTAKDEYRIEERSNVDMRTTAGKHRKEATVSKPELVLEMLRYLSSTVCAGLTILCDSWFTSPSFIASAKALGYGVIGLHKENRTKYYTFDGRAICVADEARKIKEAIKAGHKFGSIAKSIPVYIVYHQTRIKGKLIFAKNWRHDGSAVKKPYVAILTTRLDMTDEEVRQAYRRRWRIEQGFRILKSWFGLISGNSAQLFETNIALVSLAHIRYALLIACKVMLFSQHTLNQVRKILVKESIYQQPIADIADGMKRTADNIQEAVVAADDGLHKDISQIIAKSPDIPDEAKSALTEKLTRASHQQMRIMTKAMLRAIALGFKSPIHSTAIDMVTNLLVRGNVTLPATFREPLNQESDSCG